MTQIYEWDYKIQHNWKKPRSFYFDITNDIHNNTATVYLLVLHYFLQLIFSNMFDIISFYVKGEMSYTETSVSQLSSVKHWANTPNIDLLRKKIFKSSL